MPRRPLSPFLFPGIGRTLHRTAGSIGLATLRVGTKVLEEGAKKKVAQRKAAAASGHWIPGIAFGPAGARRYRLFRPDGIGWAERLPLLVMLHGCCQDAVSFAASTRMNRLAEQRRFLVLYPEQERSAHPGNCWNWFDTRTGRAQAEAATLGAMLDQVLLLYPVDRGASRWPGLSAGASMAAYLATRMPERFRAVVMHSGVPPGAAHSGASALGAMLGWREPAGPPRAGAALPPLLVIHGNRDAVVASGNARAAAVAWAEGAGAVEGTSRVVRRGQRHPMTMTEFKVRRRTVATLCEVDGLAHAWSGGDERHPHGDGGGPDASRMTWAFIARQFAKAG